MVDWNIKKCSASLDRPPRGNDCATSAPALGSRRTREDTVRRSGIARGNGTAYIWGTGPSLCQCPQVLPSRQADSCPFECKDDHEDAEAQHDDGAAGMSGHSQELAADFLAQTEVPNGRGMAVVKSVRGTMRKC